MKLLISAGGSGGGVYPALSILQALEGRTDEVLWVGGIGGMEADLVKREGIQYQEIPASGVHGLGLRTIVGLIDAVRGYFAARAILQEFQPDVMLFTGGYVAVPVALAGRKKVPMMLYVPDIEPGLALKTLSRFADRITLIAEDAKAYFPNQRNRPDRLTVTGHPVRRDLAHWSSARAWQAREALGLQPDLPTLLVFGGSKGARSINRAVFSVLPQLLDEMQIVHISGRLDWREVEAAQADLSAAQAARYRAFPYLHENMGAAYAAADLVLSRGGASAVGEFPLFGLPAILVPYPYAWRYQMVNAQYLMKNNAAVIVQDDELPGKILPTIRSLIRSPEKREEMAKAMRSLAKSDSAKNIAAQLVAMANQTRSDRRMSV